MPILLVSDSPLRPPCPTCLLHDASERLGLLMDRMPWLQVCNFFTVLAEEACPVGISAPV